ncbi:MAG: DNA internalization-related competence protein ComEC/Rec2 [Clostridia bacterium]|nr:DNA internalization-related competence protein ComEC/Rec2 [Clostridia bacterium]
MRRKIILPAFFYAAGILIYQNYTYIWQAIFLILAIFVLSTVFNLKQVVCLLLCFFIGISNTYLYTVFHDEHLENVSGTFTMKILDIKEDKLTCKYSKSKVLVTSYTKDKFQASDFISVTGTFVKPKTNTNPHCFNYDRYLKTRGIFYTLNTSNISLVSHSNSMKARIIQKREDFLSHLPDESRGLIRGICFGDKSEIDDNTLKWFQENGTAHVLAVSGLHIGLIYLAIRKLLYKKHKLIYFATVILVLSIYGLMTGWSISVIRASILILINLLSFILERRYDLTASIFTAALILLTFNPYQLYSAGFQMSFLAVLSIAFFDRLKPVFSVQIGIGIFTMYTFNYISLITVIVNIPTVFLVTYLVPLVFIQFILFTPLNIVIGDKLTTLLTQLLKSLNGFMYHDGLFTFNTVSMRGWMVALILILIFFVKSEYFNIEMLRRNYTKLLSILLILILITPALFFNEEDRFNKADLIFVDVGQGDCLHIRDHGRDYVIDGGPGEKTLKPYLLKNGAGKLDATFATHNHSDHYKGLVSLSKDFNIYTSYISSGYNTDDILAKEHEYVNNSNTIKLSKDFTIDILWPMQGVKLEDEEDENSVSLVLMVNLKGKKILVTGDIQQECEEELVKLYKNKLKCDILKVAHHGSKYSTTDEFLDYANPKIAIISVGRNNYGHPAIETLDKLSTRGIKTLRTDQQGAIGIDILNKHIKIDTICGIKYN